MADQRIEHTFNCSVDTFWDKVFFDPEYNRRLFHEALRFPEWKEVRSEDKGDRLERSIEVTPRLGDLPGPLKRVVGDGVRYREEGVFDRTARRYKMNIVPNKLADKLKIRCELFAEPLDGGKCKRVFLCHVEASIFGVGGLLERRLLEDMEKSQAVSAEFTNRFIAEKNLGGPA